MEGGVQEARTETEPEEDRSDVGWVGCQKEYLSITLDGKAI